LILELGFRFLYFSYDLGHELFIFYKFLDNRVIDFILFESEVFLLGLLEFMLEFDEFVLHEFAINFYLHLLVFESGVFFHTCFYLGLKLTIFILNSSSVEPLRVVSYISKFHDSFFQYSVLDFELLNLV